MILAKLKNWLYIILIKKYFFSVHPSIIHGPPPYTEPGLDNKTLQQSVDLVHDVTKNAVYGTQNDYNTYHTGNGLRPNGECKL